MFSNFFSENRDVSEIMWKNTECTVAFPLQQLLREHVTMLRYTYIACFIFKNPSLLWRVFHSNLQLSQIHPPHLKITPHFLMVKYIAKIVNRSLVSRKT
jgi:hypothetical protein